MWFIIYIRKWFSKGFRLSRRLRFDMKASLKGDSSLYAAYIAISIQTMQDSIMDPGLDTTNRLVDFATGIVRHCSIHFTFFTRWWCFTYSSQVEGAGDISFRHGKRSNLSADAFCQQSKFTQKYISKFLTITRIIVEIIIYRL